MINISNLAKLDSLSITSSWSGTDWCKVVNISFENGLFTITYNNIWNGKDHIGTLTLTEAQMEKAATPYGKAELESYEVDHCTITTKVSLFSSK